ncbi:MAG: nucleoside hydrolase, partial [Bacteroidia bacterium]
MRSRIIFSAFILFFALQSSFSHPWKPSHYVIIDTDGGIDDFKAISMLLASRDVRVLAIISSGGTLDAENTYKKVRSFLDGLHHEGLLVCINKNVSGYNYPLPLSIRYGNEEGIAVPPSSNFVETVKSAVSGESSPVKLISLGSLNSAAILVDAGITFAGVYWSIRGLDPVSGMNYDLDTESAGRIITGQVPLHGVGYTTQNDLYGDDMLKLVSGINTVYAQAVSSLFGSGSPLPDHPFARGGQDDMIPVFLHYPSLFTTGENGS